MFLKRLLRSSGSKLGNKELFLKAGTSFAGNWHARTWEGTESYASKKEGGSRLMGFIWERSKNEVRHM